MARWETAIITHKGLNLMAKLVAGKTLSLVRAVAGTGYVELDKLKDLTAVSGENYEMTFATVCYLGDSQCSVPVRLTNEKFDTTKTINQVGIMANDPDEGEILFLIAQANKGEGTEVPAVKYVPTYSAEWNFCLFYGQADGVTVEVDPAGTVSRAELDIILNEKIETINVQLNAFYETVKTDLSQKAPIHAVAYGILTEGDGAAYTATVEGIDSLQPGASFVMIPHVTSTTTTPTLDVNGLGAAYIRRPVSNSTVTSVVASSTNWLGANKPIRVTYDGKWWIADITRPNAADIFGTVAIENGGTGASTAEAALENLGFLIVTETDGVASHSKDDIYNARAAGKMVFGYFDKTFMPCSGVVSMPTGAVAVFRNTYLHTTENGNYISWNEFTVDNEKNCTHRSGSAFAAPFPTADDVGKVLTVNSEGAVVWGSLT